MAESTVLARIPAEFVVVPFHFHPKIRRHYLVDFILKNSTVIITSYSTSWYGFC